MPLQISHRIAVLGRPYFTTPHPPPPPPPHTHLPVPSQKLDDDLDDYWAKKPAKQAEGEGAAAPEGGEGSAAAPAEGAAPAAEAAA